MTKFEIFVTFYACVTLPVVVWVWALCRAAAKPTPKPQICTRRAPHECAVNGDNTPNQTRPLLGTYAEGRPTMPSEVEPEPETERRTR